jgi:hypothetical protein
MSAGGSGRRARSSRTSATPPTTGMARSVMTRCTSPWLSSKHGVPRPRLACRAPRIRAARATAAPPAGSPRRSLRAGSLRPVPAGERPRPIAQPAMPMKRGVVYRPYFTRLLTRVSRRPRMPSSAPARTSKRWRLLDGPDYRPRAYPRTRSRADVRCAAADAVSDHATCPGSVIPCSSRLRSFDLRLSYKSCVS